MPKSESEHFFCIWQSFILFVPGDKFVKLGKLGFRLADTEN